MAKMGAPRKPQSKRDGLKQLPIDFEDPALFHDDKLSPRQLNFAQTYVAIGNQTEAYIRTYFPDLDPKTISKKDRSRYAVQASNLKQNPHILRAINNFLEQRRRKNLLTADFLINNAVDLYERAAGKKPVIVTEKGKHKRRMVFEPSSALQTLKFLSTHKSVSNEFAESQEIKVVHSIADKMTRLRSLHNGAESINNESE